MTSGHTNTQQVLRLERLHRELAIGRRGQKRLLVEACAADLGISVQSVYRKLEECFPGNGRKRRSDAGLSRVTEEQLKLISGVLYLSQRASGKVLLTPGEAVERLQSSNLLPATFSASESNLRRLLLQAGMSPSQLKRPSPAQRQRSLHPNHVHQVDASVCVAYYLSNATGLRIMDEKEFYKNKPQNLTRVQDERLIRYVLTDHCSGVILPRYYLGSECAASLADFLIWCFSPKEELPVHGVPLILQMDMGAANTSKAVLNMLDQLDVRYIIHERHNSRANGSVEQAQNQVERGFETNLTFTHVQGLQDLNEKAVAWARDFGSKRTHTRTRMTRFAKWMEIKPEELRLAPSLEILRTLPTRTPETRRIDNNLRISFAVQGYGQKSFDLRRLPGVMPGNTVKVRLNVLQAPAIQVAYVCVQEQAEKWLTVRPIEIDEHGFETSAPIIGEEIRKGPRSVVDANREAVLIAAYGGLNQREAELRREKRVLPYGAAIDAFKPNAEAKIPAFLPRRGTPMQVAGDLVEPPIINITQFAKQAREARARRGRIPEGDPFALELYRWLERNHPNGIPEPLAEAYLPTLAQALLPAVPVPGETAPEMAQARLAGSA